MIFTNKAVAYPSGVSFGWLLTLPANIEIARKSFKCHSFKCHSSESHFSELWQRKFNRSFLSKLCKLDHFIVKNNISVSCKTF